MALASPVDLDDRLAAAAHDAWKRSLEAKRSAEQIRQLDGMSPDGIGFEALANHASIDRRWRGLTRRGPGDFPHLRGFAPGRTRGGPACFQERLESELPVVERRLIEECARGVTGAWLRTDAAIMATGSDEVDLYQDGISVSRVEQLVALWRAMPAEVQPDMRWVVECGALTGQVMAQREDLAAARAMCPGLDLGLDPLAALLRRGEIKGDMDIHMTALRELLALSEGRHGGIFHLLIGADQYHEAGATTVDELALSLASAAEYARALCQSGGDLEHAVEGCYLQLSVGGDIFMDVAKLRAARVLHTCLWEACGVSGRDLRIHARSSRRALSLSDPWTNLLRTTFGAYAAFVGAADSHSVLPHGGDDLEEGGSARAGRRLAANLHHLLAEEAQLGAVADPGGGSYHLESLTSTLARRAWAEFQAIEGAGGLMTGLRMGRIQSRLSQQRAQQVEALSTGTQCLIGATLHASAEDLPGPRRAFRGVDRPRTWAQPARRDAAARRGQTGPEDLKIDRMGTERWTMDFERLRAQSLAHGVQCGRPIRAVLVTDEPGPRRRRLLDWAADRLRVVGIQVAPELAAKDLDSSVVADVVVLCFDAESGSEQPLDTVRAWAQTLTVPVGARVVWASQTSDTRHSVDFAEFTLLAGRPQLVVMAELLAAVTGTTIELSTTREGQV